MQMSKNSGVIIFVAKGIEFTATYPIYPHPNPRNYQQKHWNERILLQE